MSDHNTVLLPSKPKIVSEEGFAGVYEIDGLYPGYGHTLGNSLRRIILSSLPGAAITAVKINGVDHEFSTLEGVKEDVINIILNLKKVRFKMLTGEPQKAELKIKGIKDVTAADVTVPGQLEVLNPEQVIATVTDKNTELVIEMFIESGLGYIPKEQIQKERVDIGTIALDAIFTPIRRVNYEVENMRVGDRTDFNKLRIFVETDGTLTPREAVENSIAIMIKQLKAIVGFAEEEVIEAPVASTEDAVADDNKAEIDNEFLKTRIETLDLSSRTINALSGANIRTVGGLARKKEKDLGELDGLGAKGIQEIKDLLVKYGISLK
ncbi:MAG: DNA-directed RNA polymerase subunit alpha [bacterium]